MQTTTDTNPQLNPIESRLTMPTTTLPEFTTGLPHLRDSDSIACNGRDYTVGTVVGYATRRHLDPIAEHTLAVGRGHSTVWANQDAVMLYDGPRMAEPVRTTVALRALVVIEGHVYRIDPDHNANLKLVLVGRVDFRTIVPVSE